MFIFIFFILILLISVTFHEYAHGWVAYKLGDSTAKDCGRLTLNPLSHIDIFGTVILPILLLAVSTRLGHPFSFGYAKPVPINPYHFKNPKKDIRWVGAAGPAANVLIALLLSLIIKAKLTMPVLIDILIWGIMINLILAIFNILPIPPLDGSKIVASFLSSRISYKYLKLQTYGFLSILLLIHLRFFDWFLLPIVNIFFRVMGISNYYPF